jgi:hypothetical protein
MSTTHLRLLAAVLAACAALAGCSAASDDTTGDVTPHDDGGRDGEAEVGDVTDAPEVVVCSPNVVQCVGGDAHTCNATGDGWVSIDECVDPTATCVPEVGCAVCNPDAAPTCVDGMTARDCAADGSAWITDNCDSALGEHCEAGECTDLSAACQAARLANSYEACDYFGTQTINAELRNTLDVGSPPPFKFAFVVGNRQTTDAHVEVQTATGVAATATVAPNSTQTIELEWNEAVRRPSTTPSTAWPTYDSYYSALYTAAAYRVKSDVPVTVYQFNPLKYVYTVLIYSFSSDASLLLPKHVLTGNYMVASRPTFMWRSRNPALTPPVDSYRGIPGFFTVVGVEDGTSVTVTFTADTVAGQTGSGISAYTAGSTATFMLDKFDVLQILSRVPADCTVTREEVDPANPSLLAGYCEMPRTLDLTGTLIRATRPVALFSGHSCSFVPYDRWACDHLEEQIFPLEAWGKRYLASRSDPIADAPDDEPNVWRVISREDDNDITFMPDAWIPVTLDRGEFIEISSKQDFVIEGTQPLLAVQFLYGEGSDLDSIGDPSMSLAVPIEQYRTGYNFLAPEDYHDDAAIGLRGQNWVNVMAPMTATVTLDGTPVTGLTAVEGTTFGVARVQIPGGSHAISSTVEFGITCYGYGNYTSYMYPGGLDVDPINPFL